LGLLDFKRNKLSFSLFPPIAYDLIVHTDGGARKNPGPGAIGAVFKDPVSGKIIRTTKKYIGVTTNNRAEYIAVIESLRVAKELKAKRLKILTDSELLVKQMKGAYKTKNETLKKLHDKIETLSKEFEVIAYEHIKREENSSADALVNQAIDAHLKKTKVEMNQI